MGQEPESEVPHRRGFLARVYLPTGRGLPPKRRYLLMLTILLAIVLIIGFIGISSIRTSQSKTMTPYTLAISTALSGPQEEAGQEALQGVRLYLNSINRAGGVNGHPLNLLVFNDRANPTTAVQVAHQVVASPALLLLGPLYSTVALPTNPIYKNAHLPAISASVSNDSITSSNPFFFALARPRRRKPAPRLPMFSKSLASTLPVLSIRTTLATVYLLRKALRVPFPGVEALYSHSAWPKIPHNASKHYIPL